MTPEEIVQLFIRSQDLLQVRGDRIQLLAWRDMETLAKLCGLVEQNNPGDTPADLALTRLACTCAAALTTSVIDAPDNADIIREWTPPPASIVVSIRPGTR
jgi:hypothetical protein